MAISSLLEGVGLEPGLRVRAPHQDFLQAITTIISSNYCEDPAQCGSCYTTPRGGEGTIIIFILMDTFNICCII